MILASKSRMGLVGLIGCTMGPRLLPLIAKSWAWFALSAFFASLSIWGVVAHDQIQTGIRNFKGARTDSTRVGETLQRIAWERWQSEAVWFGHGTVQPGPHLVEYMPIGSHHTWHALLFVKGVVGFLAFIIPFFIHMAVVVKDTVHNGRGQLPLGILMTFLLLSFGENIEIEVYLM